LLLQLHCCTAAVTVAALLPLSLQLHCCCADVVAAVLQLLLRFYC
jgi:hypothetical protein